VCFSNLMLMVERAGAWCKDNIILCVAAAFLLGFLVTLYFLRAKLDDTTEIVISDVAHDDALPGEVTVDLSGAVNNPGVYTLSNSSRISDLLRVGEGFSGEAAVSWIARNLNLSRPLADAEKIYIPFEWDIVDGSVLEPAPLVRQASAVSEPSGGEDSEGNVETDGATVSTNDALINVNTATLDELDGLEGIGPKYAQKIVDGRSYDNYAALIESSGVPESVFVKIKDEISF
jgi:competence protein ComEA